jgi:erythromycin esterase
MGQDIALRHRSELYTMGLYMYQGNAAWNTRGVYSILPVSDTFLEGILHQSGEPYFFLDLLHQTGSGTPAWVTGEIWARTWGYYNRRIVPRNQYDAILFIDQVTVPNYVN